MRTLGRHTDFALPQQYDARCEVCGVVWRRADLREDGQGRLICPDEGDGLDAMTLAIQSAEDLEAFFQRQRPEEHRGIPLKPSELRTNPLGILEDVTGWWAPDIALSVRTADVYWRNAAPDVFAGELYAHGTLPTSSAGGLLFAGGDALVSSWGKLIRAGDEPTLWMVTSLTEETDDHQEMLAVTTGGSSATAVAGVAIGRYRSDVNDGDVYGWVKFHAGDPGFTVLAPRPAAGQHIYRLTVTASQLTLAIDDDEYTATPTYGAGLQVPLGIARMGHQAHGTYLEGAVTR